MNTEAKIQVLELAGKYLHMIKYAEFLIKTQKEDIKRYPDFLNRQAFCESRIDINEAMIDKMNNRLTTLLKSICK